MQESERHGCKGYTGKKDRRFYPDEVYDAKDMKEFDIHISACNVPSLICVYCECHLGDKPWQVQSEENENIFRHKKEGVYYSRLLLYYPGKKNKKITELPYPSKGK